MSPLRRIRDDDGSILPLTIFFGFLGLVLVLLVVAASSLYLERKRLFTVADGAALVGAEAFELDQVTVQDGSLDVDLVPADVEAAVRDYLAGSPASDLDDLTIVQAGSPDGESAAVTLSATWHPPVVSALVPNGLSIEVTSTARSVFWRAGAEDEGVP